MLGAIWNIQKYQFQYLLHEYKREHFENCLFPCGISELTCIINSCLIFPLQIFVLYIKKPYIFRYLILNKDHYIHI